MEYLKTKERIELSYPQDTGYGFNNKQDKAKFVNKYLYESNEFEKLKKQIDELNNH